MTALRRQSEGMTRRGLLALGVGAAAGTLWPALRPAGPAAWAAAERRGGTLTVGINTDLVSLDPNDIVFANVPMFFQVYNYLVKYTTTLQARPDLAEFWDPAKDGMSVVFRLRDGVRTHSGGTFGADALIANFRRTKEKATGGGLFSRLADWESADRVDARSVRFRFSHPHPDYLAQIARWGMVDPAAFAGVKNKGGGTGPFRVQEWVPGDHITFARFDGYWQQGLPLLDRVVCRVYSDPQALENAFQAGTIDVAHTIVNKDVGRLRQAGFRITPAPVPNEYYVLVINTRRPPFDNLRVRQAVQLLVDRATVVRTVLGGVGAPVAQMVTPASPGYDPALDTEYGYNPAKAKQILASAGAGRPARLTLLTSTSTPELPQIAQIIQADLKQAGLDVEITIHEPAQYFPPYFAGNFDLSLSFLTLATIDPTDFTISSAFRTDGTNPAWLQTGPPREYVEGLQSLNATPGMRERWTRLRGVIRYILGQAWAVPVALRLPTYGLGKGVEGFDVDPQMLIQLKGAWLNR
jgi:peptide/nickel transport system substrate-binding protein